MSEPKNGRVVVAAAVVREGLLLAARRCRPAELAGRWELPGGKVEDGETETEALRREVREELGVELYVDEPIGPETGLGDGAVLRTYLATPAEGTEPAPTTDHDAVRFLGPEELTEVDWLEPDRAIVDAVRERLLDGVQLAGGNVGGAVRVGTTVRRPTGPWTPTIHAFLRHLEERGLDSIPRVHGIDERGREILSFLPGRTIGDLGAVANVDRWPQWAFTDRLMTEVGAWLRRYHDAARDFRPAGELQWRAGTAPIGDQQIVCHNDVSPYNAVVDDESGFVGMLDWDLAQPGRPIDDVAFAAWNFVPFLKAIPPAEAARRLRLLTTAYDVYSPGEVLETVVERMRRAVARIRAGAEAGDPGMRHLVDIGEMAFTEQALDRLEAQLPQLRPSLI